MRDLEAELDLEQRRARDAAAENKKLQKQLVDLRVQADDDHRMVAELSDQVSTLQMKIVTIKRQLDENVCDSRYSCLSVCFTVFYSLGFCLKPPDFLRSKQLGQLITCVSLLHAKLPK